MATPAPKKTVKLRIKLPANVTVITEFVKVPAELPINLPAAQLGLGTQTVMDMDLTSSKTSEWLRKKTIASSDCSNCCCVRG